MKRNPRNPELHAPNGLRRRAKSLGASLREHRDVVGLYKTLATLRTDVPLKESLADLKWKGANRPALEALCQKIGYPRFVDRVKQFA